MYNQIKLTDLHLYGAKSNDFNFPVTSYSEFWTFVTCLLVVVFPLYRV